MNCRVVFFGTPNFAAKQLQALLGASHVEVGAVVTQPDRPAGRGGKLSPSPVKVLAQLHELPVLQPENLKRELIEFLAELDSLGPFHIGVVAAFGQIIPKPILNFPRAGMVNVHASLLPRWRGAAPIHRAIISGDRETGTCLMQMEPTLDTGAVFVQERVPITKQDTTGSLEEKLAESGARLLASHLLSIANSSIKPTPQDESRATYANKISNDEARISWVQTAVDIERLIRGLNPFPGAFTEINGKRLKVFAAKPKPGAADMPPGSVAIVDRHMLEIQCGEGRLALTEVQLEGKGKLPVADFLRGFPVRPGNLCK